MSGETFKAFLAKVQHDETLRRELRGAGGEGGMSIESLAAFAAGKGYAFKVEDVSDELSEAQLDMVAGGAEFPKIDGLTQIKLDGFLKIDTYLSSSGGLMFKF